MKRFYYDLETTGVNPAKHGIHQISGKIVADKITTEGKIQHVEVFNFKVQPNPKAIIDPEALAIGNVTEDQIKAYPPIGEVYRQLIALLGKNVDKFNKRDKYHLVGFNNRGFDDNFLRGFFLQNDDKYFGSWFWSDSIDVMVLASEHLEEQRSTMENFKLKTVASKLGIEVDETRLHDAQYDIELTEQILNIIRPHG